MNELQKNIEPTTEEILDEMAFEKRLQEEADRYRREDFLGVKDAIAEFKNEQPVAWREERRLEYLDGAMRDALREIEDYKRLKSTTKEMFIFDDQLKNWENKYKRYYIEYASLHGQRDYEDGKHNDEAVQQCRDVPIDTINPQPMKPGGKNRQLGLCPFHNENTPSFWVFEENSFHCFGCQANGQNAIDFIMKLKSISFREAIDYLKKY